MNVYGTKLGLPHSDKMSTCVFEIYGSNKCIATSNKGITTSGKKLLVTSASLPAYQCLLGSSLVR